ncbi:hypothetical protein Tco_0793645 [Tanacetum coccineum]
MAPTVKDFSNLDRVLCISIPLQNFALPLTNVNISFARIGVIAGSASSYVCPRTAPTSKSRYITHISKGKFQSGATRIGAWILHLKGANAFDAFQREITRHFFYLGGTAMNRGLPGTVRDRAVFIPSFKFLAIKRVIVIHPSKNAYSRWMKITSSEGSERWRARIDHKVRSRSGSATFRTSSTSLNDILLQAMSLNIDSVNRFNDIVGESLSITTFEGHGISLVPKDRRTFQTFTITIHPRAGGSGEIVRRQVQLSFGFVKAGRLSVLSKMDRASDDACTEKRQG